MLRPTLVLFAIALDARSSLARPAARVDLPRTIALARECVSRGPHHGKGPGGAALDRTPIGLERIGAGPTWGVMFVEDDPARGGVQVVIDPSRDTCDGKRVRVRKPASRVIDVDALIAKARQCAAGAPWQGSGVGGHPLVTANPTVSYHPFDDGLVIGFAETEIESLPSGLQLSVSLDGKTCGAVLMD